MSFSSYLKALPQEFFRPFVISNKYYWKIYKSILKKKKKKKEKTLSGFQSFLDIAEFNERLQGLELGIDFNFIFVASLS